ncbi:MAG: hypothetical protein R2771_16410 [Saprospiraceae bacterium]
MDGKLNKNKVICCFCGETLELEKAVILNIKPSINSDEYQNLFSHKNHFLEKLDKNVILHPDFFDEV